MFPSECLFIDFKRVWGSMKITRLLLEKPTGDALCPSAGLGIWVCRAFLRE